MLQKYWTIHYLPNCPWQFIAPRNLHCLAGAHIHTYTQGHTHIFYLLNFCSSNVTCLKDLFVELFIDFLFKTFYSKPHFRDFPCGPAVKSPLFNSGDTGSIPGRGTKTLQLNPWVTIREKPIGCKEWSSKMQQRSHVSQLRPNTYI